MGFGIMDTLALGASLVFALPLGIFAINQLRAGDHFVGGFLLLVAVLMVVLPQRLTTPGDIPGKIVGGLVGRAVVDPDERESNEE